MTAVSSDGLKISKDGTSWKDAINMGSGLDDEQAFQLKPATLLDKTLATGKPTFHAPVYSGNAVNGTTAIAEANWTNYVAKCTYYLKAEGSNPVDVGIITVDPDSVTGGQGVTAEGFANEGGSFVKGTVDAGKNNAMESVRIALVVGGQLYLYEPNSGTTNKAGATFATNGLVTLATPDVVSNFDDGQITTGSLVDGTPGTISKALFEVGTTSTQVDMYLWFEGQDDQCVDQIISDNVFAQIQFTVIE